MMNDDYTRISMRDYRAACYDHEPSIPVHNVFSRAIPGAFGIDFFRRLIAASNQPLNENSEGKDSTCDKSSL